MRHTLFSACISIRQRPQTIRKDALEQIVRFFLANSFWRKRSGPFDVRSLAVIFGGDGDRCQIVNDRKRCVEDRVAEAALGQVVSLQSFDD